MKATSHKAFLTVEALVDMANYTIQGLDEWEKKSASPSVKLINKAL